MPFTVPLPTAPKAPRGATRTARSAGVRKATPVLKIQVGVRSLPARTSSSPNLPPELRLSNKYSSLSPQTATTPGGGSFHKADVEAEARVELSTAEGGGQLLFVIKFADSDGLFRNVTKDETPSVINSKAFKAMIVSLYNSVLVPLLAAYAPRPKVIETSVGLLVLIGYSSLVEHAYPMLRAHDAKEPTEGGINFFQSNMLPSGRVLAMVAASSDSIGCFSLIRCMMQTAEGMPTRVHHRGDNKPMRACFC